MIIYVYVETPRMVKERKLEVWESITFATFLEEVMEEFLKIVPKETRPDWQEIDLDLVEDGWTRKNPQRIQVSTIDPATKLVNIMVDGQKIFVSENFFKRRS
jgi:hypothetical protein